MTRPFRFALLAVLLIAAVLTAAIARWLPPVPVVTPAAAWPPSGFPLRGAYHVHSTISDGTGTIDEIAAAAAAAGLAFVILTDHGDGTRQPDPPRYMSGVLVIEGVEINTSGGHLVALGAAPSAYPLAGAPRAVLEDVHRLGGFGVAAHPGSPRTSLQWTDTEAPVDGLEWLNADSEWRDELPASLGRLLITYALRPAETLASMLDRPDDVLARWDALARTRPVMSLAGTDAHQRLGFRRQQTDPFEEGWHLRLPGYEASFRAFSTHVVLDAPLSGDPVRDAGVVLGLLRHGRSYTVIDAVASPGGFDFRASSGGVFARMGDVLDIVDSVLIEMRMAAPPGTRMILLRDGAPFFETTEAEARVNVLTAPGVYRVELEVPGVPGRPPVPWLVSNPIYVGLREAHARAAAGVARAAAGARGNVATEMWTAEASADSTSRLHADLVLDGVAALGWQFGLAPGRPAGQYAALRFPVAPGSGGLSGRDRVQLRLRADRPMRVWVQVRTSAGVDGERWGRSLYLDQRFRSADLFFDEFVPLGQTSSPLPPLDRIDALLLVVDTVNTQPGSTGTIQIAEMWLGSPAR